MANAAGSPVFVDFAAAGEHADDAAHYLGSRLGLTAAPVQRLCDGITNKLFKVGVGSGAHLIRIYGPHTELLVNRDAEVAVMQHLAEHGLAAPLLARFRNGLVYGFVPGAACTPCDIANPSVWPSIAAHVALWHALPLPPTLAESADGRPQITPTLHRWLKCVRDAKIGIPIVPGRPSLDIEALSKAVESTAHQLPTGPGVLAHNDLLSANIIRLENGDVSFIDYEYGGVGLAAFDIANHFAEWAGFDCDWSRCPDTPTMRAWVTHYTASLEKNLENPSTASLSSSSMPNTDPELLLSLVQRCSPAVHLFWTLWALVQSCHSEIDFDYTAYARKRWMRYNDLTNSNPFPSI